MMPAMCVPWPNGSPVTLGSFDTRLTRATTRPEMRGVIGDTRVDDGDADAAPVTPGWREQAEQPALPAQTFSARVTWLTIATSATTGRSPEMCATPPSATRLFSSAR